MIGKSQDRLEVVTYATADKIEDVVLHLDNKLNNTTDYEPGELQEESSRIADDLNEVYRGWWGENRYKITFIVEKI